MARVRPPWGTYDPDLVYSDDRPTTLVDPSRAGEIGDRGTVVRGDARPGTRIIGERDADANYEDQTEQTYSPTATKRTSRTQRELEWNLSAADTYIPIILGSRRVGPGYVYAKGDPQATNLWLMGGLCEGPVSAVQPFMNGAPMTLRSTGEHWTLWSPLGYEGQVSCWIYDGEQDTTMDGQGLELLKTFDAQYLDSAKGEEVQDQPFTGLALMIARLTWDVGLLQNVPTFTFDVDGSKCYDPRTLDYRWTENPAIAIREVLTNATWGLGNPSTAINDASFVAAANACDAQLDNGNKRYRINLVLSTQSTAADWLDTLLAHCLGILTFVNGKYELRIDDVWTAPVTQHFSTTNYVELGQPMPANVVPASVKLTRRSRSTMYNAVRVFYSDAGDYPAATSPWNPAVYYDVGAVVFYAGNKHRSKVTLNQGHAPTGLENDPYWRKLAIGNRWQSASVLIQTNAVKTGVELQRLVEYRLDGCPTKDQALRTGTTRLNRLQDDLTVEFQASRAALALVPGDVFDFNGAGLAWQKFRAKTVTTLDDAFEVTGEEYHDASYNTTVNEEDSPVSSGLPDPDAIPPDPSGVTATVQPNIPGPDGRMLLRVKVDWTPGETPFYETTVVTVFDGVLLRTLGEFAQGPAYIENPPAGVDLIITLYTRTTWGKLSPGLQITITPENPGDVPDVLNLTLPHETVADHGKCYWTDPDYAFIKRFEIYDTFGDPDAPALVATIPVGSSPTESFPLDISNALHGDGYIASESLDVTVYVVSTTEGYSNGIRRSWTIPASGMAEYGVSGDPRAIASDGSNVWVTNYGSNSVTKLTRTGTHVGTYPVGIRPYGVWHDSVNGRVWIANSGDTPTAMCLNAGTGAWVASMSDAQTSVATGITGAHFVDNSGAQRHDLWIATNSPTSPRLVRMEANFTGTFSATPGPTWASGTTYSLGAQVTYPAGGWQYVSLQAGNQGHTPSTSPTWWIKPLTQRLTPPGGQTNGGPLLIVAPRQTIGGYAPGLPAAVTLYSSWFSGSVLWKIDLMTPLASLSTGFQSVELGANSGPWGMCYDGTNIWVACYSSHSIVCLDQTSGTILGSVSLGSGSAPVDVTWDGETIWATDGLGRQLVRINPTAFEVVGRIPLGSYPRMILYDGTDLWVPCNTNGTVETVRIGVRSPAPGGGDSVATGPFLITGVDLSPFPS